MPPVWERHTPIGRITASDFHQRVFNIPSDRSMPFICKGGTLRGDLVYVVPLVGSNTAVLTRQLVDWRPAISSEARASKLGCNIAKLLHAFKRVSPFGRHLYMSTQRLRLEARCAYVITISLHTPRSHTRMFPARLHKPIMKSLKGSTNASSRGSNAWFSSAAESIHLRDCLSFPVGSPVHSLQAKRRSTI